MINKKSATILIIALVFGWSHLCFAQEKTFGGVPETFEEAKELGEQAIKTGIENLPGMMKETFEERVLPIWKKMYEWFETNIMLKIKVLLEQEIETRKPIIEQEFEKEKQELKEELPEVTKSIWQRLKELWQ